MPWYTRRPQGRHPCSQYIHGITVIDWYVHICSHTYETQIQFRQILTQYLLVLKYFELPKGLNRGPKDKICHQITILQCSLVVTLSMAQMQIVKNAECTLPNPDSHFTSFFNISFPDFHTIKIQSFVK